MAIPEMGGKLTEVVDNGSVLLSSTYGPGGTGNVVKSVTRTVVPDETPMDWEGET